MRRGVDPGSVRAWWTGNLCTEMAMHTARMIQDAASAMFDARPKRGRQHHILMEFERDQIAGKDVPAFQRNLSAEDIQRANGSELPSAFIHDLCNGQYLGSLEVEVAAGADASGDGAVMVGRD